MGPGGRKGIFEDTGFVLCIEGIPTTPGEAPVGDSNMGKVLLGL